MANSHFGGTAGLSDGFAKGRTSERENLLARPRRSIALTEKHSNPGGGEQQRLLFCFVGQPHFKLSYAVDMFPPFAIVRQLMSQLQLWSYCNPVPANALTNHYDDGSHGHLRLWRRQSVCFVEPPDLPGF